MAAPRFQAGLHSPHLCGPYAAKPLEQPQQEKSSGLQVYCDLDGVLADFNKGCLQLFPEGGAIAQKIPTHLVTRLTYEEETEMWRRVESKSDFFLSLDWTSDGEELWRWIDWNVVPSPAILTGLPMGRAGQMASKQKEQWCHERLGSHVAVFCCGTRNKQKFSGPNCVLIDDRGDLREAWEARGGIFIHHTSAVESIRQLREVLKVCHGKVQDEQMPLQLTSVCWAAQTPAGCFKSKCRYLHVPISRRHRSWIQLWGFVWWHQRMFDDLKSLMQCIHAVYSPDHQATFKGKDDQMDEQSHGAFRKMLETLRECCDLGLPLADIIADDATKYSAPPSPLPPLPWQVKEVHSKITQVVQSLEILGDDPHLVVAGSMGLGADVGGSDLDLVLCCEIEVDPKVALPALRDALEEAGEASDLLLLDQVLVPLLSFRIGGLSVDITMNQMSSIRDIVLFRYALRSAGSELSATLRLLKMWIKARRIPGNKQGGFPNVVWLRMAVRFYQESKGSVKRVARDWLRRFMAWAWQGLPTGGSPLTLHGEQEYYSGKLAAGVPSATLLLFVTEMVTFLERAPAPSSFGEDFDELPAHSHLCIAGSWHNSWALFFVGGEGHSEASREVLLCRVLTVMGGREAELRPCDCEDCDRAGAHAVKFISRRSQDWLILATREDPRKLRVQSALQHRGVTKKKQTQVSECQEDDQSNTWILLRPSQLIRRLHPSEDPLKEFQKTQQAAASAEWLPNPEVAGHQIPRQVLLLYRQLGDELAGAASCPERRPAVTTMKLQEVCCHCPWMEAAASEDEEENAEPVESQPVLPAGPFPRDFELAIERGSSGLLGMTVEAMEPAPLGLRVASISAGGAVGQWNRSASVQLKEGDVILEINGVRDVEAMRDELQEPCLKMLVRSTPGETDEFGRRIGAKAQTFALPHAEVKGEMPRCRCSGHCKCGLADALGRARDDRKMSAAQPALHIANLHPAVSEEMLYDFFVKVSPVATVRVVRDTKTLASEQHGYVNFYTFQDAEKVLKTLDGAVVHGRRCLLSWSTRAKQPADRLTPHLVPAESASITSVRIKEVGKEQDLGSGEKNVSSPADVAKSASRRRKVI